MARTPGQQDIETRQGYGPGHHGDDEVAPDVTTVQGLQVAGLEYGHEEADINLGSTLRWFAALTVVVVFTLGLISGALALYERTADDRTVDSQVFQQPQIPPKPRILPNPVDWPGGALEKPVEAPPKELEVLREQEAELLQKAGLMQGTEQHIPQDVVTAVATKYGSPTGHGSPAPGGTGGAEGHGPETSHKPGTSTPGQTESPVQDSMPSDSSGGLSTENRLK
jgi:hypothetical protein